MSPNKQINNTMYISDLDGTLLRNDASISVHSKEILHSLLQQGIQFTVASARNVNSMRQILMGLQLELPVIGFNGAFISDLETGRHQLINQIDPAIAEAIYQLLNRFGCIPFISTFNGIEDCLYYKEITNQGMQWYLSDRIKHQDKRLRSLKNLSHALCDQVICLTVIGLPNVLFELEYAIKDQMTDSVETHLIENQYSPGWYWLTIHDYRATKDRAIRTLLKDLKLDNCELVVFGDNDNDIKMFQLADRAIAVSNASVRLKRWATQIIDSNHNDSVARFIDKDWKAKVNQGQFC